MPLGSNVNIKYEKNKNWLKLWPCPSKEIKYLFLLLCGETNYSNKGTKHILFTVKCIYNI